MRHQLDLHGSGVKIALEVLDPVRSVDYAYVAQRLAELQVEVGLRRVAFDPKDLWGVGALSANDILGFEDMNGIGADGDIRFVPLNYVPLDQARANAKAAIAEPPAPTAPDQPAPDTMPAKQNGATDGSGLPH